VAVLNSDFDDLKKPLPIRKPATLAAVQLSNQVLLVQAAAQEHGRVLEAARLQLVVAAQELGQRLLEQRHPELVGVQPIEREDQAAGARAHRQRLVHHHVVPVAQPPQPEVVRARLGALRAQVVARDEGREQLRVPHAAHHRRQVEAGADPALADVVGAEELRVVEASGGQGGRPAFVV